MPGYGSGVHGFTRFGIGLWHSIWEVSLEFPSLSGKHRQAERPLMMRSGKLRVQDPKAQFLQALGQNTKERRMFNDNINKFDYTAQRAKREACRLLTTENYNATRCLIL